MNRFDFADLGYGDWAKVGFLFGLGLFVFGAGGEIIGHAVVGALPLWENTLFTYSEGVGIIIGFFSPWIFGVALPILD